MKLKIKVKRINKAVMLPKVIKKGEWIDLSSSEEIIMNAPQSGTLKKTQDGSFRNVDFSSTMIPLGIAMQLPKGFEAVILPRSGTFKTFGIILANNEGVIDNSYCGDTDEWKFHGIAFRQTKIEVGDRICQFRIQLSQKATVIQKLKWLFSSGIKIVEVTKLSNNNRGGFGTTGTK